MPAEFPHAPAPENETLLECIQKCKKNPYMTPAGCEKLCKTLHPFE